MKNDLSTEQLIASVLLMWLMAVQAAFLNSDNSEGGKSYQLLLSKVEAVSHMMRGTNSEWLLLGLCDNTYSTHIQCEYVK